jgi:glyoxylase-like metal-dependent hydrolase (beta-lactamase superfamily II)
MGTPRVDRYVKGGDRIELDNFCVDVYHTPGHSPGGVTYRYNDLLFVGDTLFAGSVGRTDLVGGSFEELVSSVKNVLFPLGDDKKVLSGHGPVTTIGEERLYNPFLRDTYMA